MKSEPINRRDFLKYSALLTANSFMLLGGQGRGASLLNRLDQEDFQLGRILYEDVKTYQLPDATSEVIGKYTFNDVVECLQAVTVNAPVSVSKIWYQLTDKSYLPAKDIQLVENSLNEPVMEIESNGQLAEITVPYTTAVINQWNHDQKPVENLTFFYGSTHWVYGLGKDEKKKYYYLVKEDRWDDSFYVDATHMRLISDQELQPTSSTIDQTKKVIRINLKEQYLVAYENEEAVFMSAISSGQLTGSVDLTTPTGNFIVNYKRPSRHMEHSDRMGSNDGDLYGVPWVSFFTDSGIAFHGTYWHNDFSQPRSHGCINMPIPAARWIYLWTQPVVPAGEVKYVSNKGTRVEVY
jgi:lipoprotein-anchoring transpeptidase ErfK/SrfK